MTIVTSSKILKNALKKVVWNWPLTTGVVDYRNDILTRQLQNTKWSNRFSKVIRVNERTNGEFEILLFSSQTSLDRFLKQSKAKITSSVVLVNIEPGVFSKKPWKDLDKTATNIFKKIKTGGVIYFGSDVPLRQWYDNLLFELSHNWPVAGAVDMISRGNARIYMTKKIAEQTRLATVLPQLIKDLETAPDADKRYVEDLELEFGLIKRYTFRELLMYLKENISHLKYDREKDTATTVNKIRAALKTNPVHKEKKIPLKTTDKRKKAVKRATRKKAARKPPPGYAGYTGRASNRKGAKKKAARKASKHYAVKKGAKKIVVKKKAKKVIKKTKHASRYLLAAFKKPRSTKIINDYLLPKTKYQLCIKIGLDDISFIRANEEFDTTQIFKSPKIKEVVIDLLIRFDQNDKLYKSKITVPRIGDSNTALIPFTSPEKGILKAEVLAFFKNRLMQKARLSIEVRNEMDSPELSKPVFRIEALLQQNLGGLKQNDGVDISVVSTTNSPPRSTGMRKGKRFSFTYTPDLEIIIKEIKDIIEENAPPIEGKSKLEDEANVVMLRQLAIQGYKLYHRFFNAEDLKGTLQLINNVKTYLPLEFAYTRSSPGGNSKLCKHAKKGLLAGKCQNCIGSEEDEGNFICPMSFWLLRQPVERHQYKKDEKKLAGDYVLSLDPLSQRKPLAVLCNAIHGASQRVDANTKNLTKKLSSAIETTCKTLKVAKNWNEWKSLVPGKPDSLILVVHIDRNEATRDDCLELGKDMLDNNQLTKHYIKSESKPDGPFVILIGCEASKTKGYMFDTVSQLMENGAAVVVSNFSDILGEHAAEIVMEITKTLKEQNGKTATFGEVMLKVRQNLVADGNMMGLSLLSHGDTRWKIKV